MKERINSRPKARTSNFTRGGQILFHNIRMYIQIMGKLATWAMLASAIITIIYAYLSLDANALKAAQYYWEVRTVHQFKGADTSITLNWNGQDFTNTISYLKQSALLNDGWETVKSTVLLSFAFSFVTSIIMLVAFSRFLERKGKEQTEDCLVRGVRVDTPEKLTEELKKTHNMSDFRLDKKNVFVKNFEVYHVHIGGTTGAGKSVAIRKLLNEIRARGDKAIIYDKGCTFVSRFYDDTTDVILNPFDERSAYWDVWQDAKHPTDFENHAMSLIPEHGDGDPFWVQSARTIFSSTAYKMQNDGKPCTTERLLELILTSQLETLTEYLDGTESASLVSDKIQKTAISIKSVLAAYIKSLRFLEGLDKPDKEGNPRRKFSIQDWVLNDNEKGFLFLTSNAKQHPSLRPLISMWLSIASTAILSLSESQSRRIWVIIDEAPSLHKLPELPNVLSEVRKHGGCFLLGFQSYAQFVKVYGQHAADEMMDLLNTRLYFRNPSAAMAKKTSDDLGEQEIELSKEQYSYGADSVRDGISLGHQTITRPAVTASEVMQLDNLQCWLRTPGNYPITRLDLAFNPMPQVARSFVFRDYESSEAMKKVDALLTHYQLGALSELDDNDRKALLAIHNRQFEGDDCAQESEEERMKSAILSQEQKDDRDIEKQKRKEEAQYRAQLATPEQHDIDADNNLDNNDIEL
ncbi:type IV conjugative transfer system coupling protein TraD [Aliivibrio fischeri]|uniref:Conjugal transfer protein TraD n=1 Tax=Aliivibrio fischeri TaxID=668 RepID=A0A510UML2_ALIFS|nr:type IV conjugative transfer system coupling protein TraD [Aliivibrio fischeri]GEK15903.1 conjugal transfer protein TraD [Aliivibrio fischeri]